MSSLHRPPATTASAPCDDIVEIAEPIVVRRSTDDVRSPIILGYLGNQIDCKKKWSPAHSRIGGIATLWQPASNFSPAETANPQRGTLTSSSATTSTINDREAGYESDCGSRPIREHKREHNGPDRSARQRHLNPISEDLDLDAGNVDRNSSASGVTARGILRPPVGHDTAQGNLRGTAGWPRPSSQADLLESLAGKGTAADRELICGICQRPLTLLAEIDTTYNATQFQRCLVVWACLNPPVLEPETSAVGVANPQTLGSKVSDQPTAACRPHNEAATQLLHGEIPQAVTSTGTDSDSDDDTDGEEGRRRHQRATTGSLTAGVGSCPCHTSARGWKVIRAARTLRSSNPAQEDAGEAPEEKSGFAGRKLGESPARSATLASSSNLSLNELAAMLGRMSITPSPVGETGTACLTSLSMRHSRGVNTATLRTGGCILPCHELEIDELDPTLETALLDDLDLRSSFIDTTKGFQTFLAGSEEIDDGASVDPLVLKFHKRLRLAPEQIIRYKIGGQPLWIETPRSIPGNVEAQELLDLIECRRKPPPCPKCGSSRVFECQILSTLTSLLEEAHPKEIPPMMWGTAVIYTCGRDCWGDSELEAVEEVIYIQSV